jgi:hypothetical protein
MQEVTSLGILASEQPCPESLAGRNLSDRVGQACWYSSSSDWLNTEADSVVVGVKHTIRGSGYHEQPCSIRHARTKKQLRRSLPGKLHVSALPPVCLALSHRAAKACCMLPVAACTCTAHSCCAHDIPACLSSRGTGLASWTLQGCSQPSFTHSRRDSAWIRSRRQ